MRYYDIHSDRLGYGFQDCVFQWYFDVMCIVLAKHFYIFCKMWFFEVAVHFLPSD